jgi:hypothetical protein
MRADFMATVTDEEIDRQIQIRATENRHRFGFEIYEKFTINRGKSS